MESPESPSSPDAFSILSLQDPQTYEALLWHLLKLPKDDLRSRFCGSMNDEAIGRYVAWLRDHPEHKVFACVKNGGIVGALHLSGIEQYKGRNVCEFWVTTSAEARGQWIAKSLIRQAKEYAIWQENIDILYMTCQFSNRAMASLAKSTGMELMPFRSDMTCGVEGVMFLKPQENFPEAAQTDAENETSEFLLTPDLPQEEVLQYQEVERGIRKARKSVRRVQKSVRKALGKSLKRGGDLLSSDVLKKLKKVQKGYGELLVKRRSIQYRVMYFLNGGYFSKKRDGDSDALWDFRRITLPEASPTPLPESPSVLPPWS